MVPSRTVLNGQFHISSISFFFLVWGKYIRIIIVLSAVQPVRKPVHRTHFENRLLQWSSWSVPFRFARSCDVALFSFPDNTLEPAERKTYTKPRLYHATPDAPKTKHDKANIHTRFATTPHNFFRSLPSQVGTILFTPLCFSCMTINSCLLYSALVRGTSLF